MRIVSLQSGTSADGIDVALVDIRPHRSADRTVLQLRPLLQETIEMPARLREQVITLAHGRATTAAEMCEVDTLLGQAFGDAAAVLGPRSSRERVDLVVSHGQTVHHWVQGGATRGSLQLGAAPWIAEAFGAPVLSQLRLSDIAARGAGAPLMAVLDRLLLGDVARAQGRAQATLNLGGIANLQVVAPDGGVLAWDTGPGCALIDHVVVAASCGLQRYDRDGRYAASGRIDDALLARLRAHPYLASGQRGTTGRETFGPHWLEECLAGSGAPRPATRDLVATLTSLTVSTVAEALRGLPESPARLIVSGGGARNPTLMAWLRAACREQGIPVESSDRWGIAAEFKESVMFALIGYLSWCGVPIRLPGSPHQGRVLGQFSPGPVALVLPPVLGRVDAVRVSPARRRGTRRRYDADDDAPVPHPALRPRE